MVLKLFCAVAFVITQPVELLNARSVTEITLGCFYYFSHASTFQKIGDLRFAKLRANLQCTDIREVFTVFFPLCSCSFGHTIMVKVKKYYQNKSANEKES